VGNNGNPIQGQEGIAESNRLLLQLGKNPLSFGKVWRLGLKPDRGLERSLALRVLLQFVVAHSEKILERGIRGVIGSQTPEGPNRFCKIARLVLKNSISPGDFKIIRECFAGSRGDDDGLRRVGRFFSGKN
jgi:hypothetical protein